jgi:hypothetical protein
MDVHARTQIKKSQKKGRRVLFIRTMAIRGRGGRNGDSSHPPRTTVVEDVPASNSQMLVRELECDDEDVTKERLVLWYREQAEMVRSLKEENKELCAEVLELKESSERNTIDMLGRAQVVHFETDLRTHRRINALVTERIFPVKKFVSGQKELDNFSGNSSLGMLVMAMLKIDKPDQLPWWNAYKNSVADAISNRRTTVTNDLKKVVMSK